MLNRIDLSSIRPLRRRSAGTRQTRAPCRIGRALRQAAAVRKCDAAAARPANAEQDFEDVRDAGSLQPGKPDDLAGPRR